MKSEKIISIEPFGECESFDLEIDHENHTFFANGISVSNSHSVSYSINSYLCAWLLTYYEPEWLCAYAEASVLKKNKKAKAISEVKSFGYEIIQVDVSYATSRWTIMDGKKMMPSFVSCKGVGDKAVIELMNNRPYKDIWEFLYNEDGSFRLSKFNKKCMDVLIRIGAFESLGCVGENKLFKNYAHMHATFLGVKNWDLVKKKLKKDTLDTQIEKVEEIAQELEDTTDWSLEEKITMFKEITGEINMNLIISSKMQKRLAKKGYNPVDVLSAEEDEEVTDCVWFVVESIVKQKTKNGKDYLTLTVSGPSGQQEKVKVWNWNPEFVVEKNKAYLAIVKKDAWGMSTKITDMRMLPHG